MFCLVIFLCMFTNNAPLKLVHSFASDPSGGGELHLVSEQKVTRLGKVFKDLLKIIWKTVYKEAFFKKIFF